MELYEKLIKSTTIHRGKILHVKVDSVELPDGRTSTREVVSHPGAVGIIALTQDKKIILVKQYRYACSKVLLEIPAGKLENNEDPLQAAIRELTEETGIVGKDFKSLGYIYVSPGYSNEIIHLYMCQVDSKTKMNPDDDEFLEPMEIKLNTALNMALAGEIHDAKTQIAILKVHSLYC